MTRPLDTQTAGPAPSHSSDRPPFGRFFMLFCALLALALGLAVLSEAGAVSEESAVDEAHAEVSQQDSSR
jgi:hypothetical protein